MGRYRVDMTMRNWSAAVANCKDIGGRLASVKTENEARALSAAAVAAMNLSPPRSSNQFWLGGKSDGDGESWRWVDGTALDDSYTWWSVAGGSTYSRRCLGLSIVPQYATTQTAWHEKWCSRAYGSICEASEYGFMPLAPPLAPAPPVPPAPPCPPPRLPFPPSKPPAAWASTFETQCCAKRSPFRCCRCNLYCVPTMGAYLLCLLAVFCVPRLVRIMIRKCMRGAGAMAALSGTADTGLRRAARRGGCLPIVAPSTDAHANPAPWSASRADRPRGWLSSALISIGQLLLAVSLMPLVLLVSGRGPLPDLSFGRQPHRWVALLPTALTMLLLGVRPSAGDAMRVLRFSFAFTAFCVAFAVLMLMEMKTHRVGTSPWIQSLLIAVTATIVALLMLPIQLRRPLLSPSRELAAWKLRWLWGVWRACMAIAAVWSGGQFIATYACDGVRCDLRVNYKELGWERAYLAALCLQDAFYCYALRPSFRLRLVFVSVHQRRPHTIGEWQRVWTVLLRPYRFPAQDAGDTRWRLPGPAHNALRSGSRSPTTTAEHPHQTTAEHQHQTTYLKGQQMEMNQLAYSSQYSWPSPAVPRPDKLAWESWPEGLAARIQMSHGRRGGGGERREEDAGSGDGTHDGPAVLGRGGFGVVISATLDGVIPVAAKLLQPFGLHHPPSMIRYNDKELADFRAEFELLVRIGLTGNSQMMPEVCRCFGTCLLSGRPALILERFEGGSLSGALHLNRTDALPLAPLDAFTERWHLAPQLASALAHLHSFGVIHRDVKVLDWARD